MDEDDFDANPGLVNAFRLAQLQTQYVLHCSQVMLDFIDFIGVGLRVGRRRGLAEGGSVQFVVSLHKVGTEIRGGKPRISWCMVRKYPGAF